MRRLVEAGRIEVVGSYHFDDMDGASRDTAKGMRAAIMPADWRDCKQGVCYLYPSDFTSGSGRAWLGENGIISLHVHSNSNYDLREIS